MTNSCQISHKALNLVVSQSAYHFPNETGGLLVGKVQNGCLFIEHATEPGPAAHHAPTKFIRDGYFSQEVLDALVKNSDGMFDYVGEWHSHPVKSRKQPSQLDLESMRWIAANEAYATNQPALLLCINAGLNRWRIRCYILVENNLRLLSIYQDHAREIELQ